RRRQSGVLSARSGVWLPPPRTGGLLPRPFQRGAGHGTALRLVIALSLRRAERSTRGAAPAGSQTPLSGALSAGRARWQLGRTLGAQHAAPGHLRSGARAGTGMPAGSATSSGALVPSFRRRPAIVQLGRPDRRLSIAAVLPATAAGDRRVHPHRAAQPDLGSAESVPCADQ